MANSFADFPEIRIPNDIRSLEPSVTWTWESLGWSQEAGRAVGWEAPGEEAEAKADSRLRDRWPRTTSDGFRHATLLGFPSSELTGWILLLLFF